MFAVINGEMLITYINVSCNVTLIYGGAGSEGGGLPSHVELVGKGRAKWQVNPNTTSLNPDEPLEEQSRAQ